MIDWKITNIVVKADLGTGLDLDKVYSRFRDKGYDVTYNRSNFPAVIFRIKIGQTRSALIFSSGRLVLGGNKTEQEIKQTLRLLVEFFKNNNLIQKHKLTYEITNLVAAAKLGKKFNLTKLCYYVPDIEYDPSDFPGAIIRLHNPRVGCLLFDTGSLVVAGAKSADDIQLACETVLRIMNEAEETYNKENVS